MFKQGDKRQGKAGKSKQKDKRRTHLKKKAGQIKMLEGRGKTSRRKDLKESKMSKRRLGF